MKFHQERGLPPRFEMRLGFLREQSELPLS
jgi:hypothetical protein